MTSIDYNSVLSYVNNNILLQSVYYKNSSKDRQKFINNFIEKIYVNDQNGTIKGYVYAWKRKYDLNTECNYHVKLGATKFSDVYNKRIKEYDVNGQLIMTIQTFYYFKIEAMIHDILKYCHVNRKLRPHLTIPEKYENEWYNVTYDIDLRQLFNELINMYNYFFQTNETNTDVEDNLSVCTPVNIKHTNKTNKNKNNNKKPNLNDYCEIQKMLKLDLYQVNIGTIKLIINQQSKLINQKYTNWYQVENIKGIGPIKLNSLKECFDL